MANKLITFSHSFQCLLHSRKFRKKLTSVHRRSAFCIFQAIKPLLNVSRIISQNERTETITESRKNTSKQSNAGVVLQNKAQLQLSNISQNGRSQKPSTKIQPLRKCSKVNEAALKATRAARDKLQQEKEDFQLAKMLQECVDIPSTRYSLRSRNKSSVSSLSSSSSSDHLALGKNYPLATAKLKKTIASMADSNNVKELGARPQRNASNTDKYMDFSFQKLTRSRRIAMTMTGA